MRDIEILNQLLHGNHLEPRFFDRAKTLIHLLDTELKQRLKK